LNLLSNAKFTPQGGHIQVQLERIDDHVQVTVSDTGQGISAEFCPMSSTVSAKLIVKQAGWIRTGIGDRASFDRTS